MNRESMRQQNDDCATLVTGCNQFGLELYQLLAQTPGENIVFSPSSLASVLAMTLAGADGKTAAEIAAALNVTPLEERVHEAYRQLQAKTKTGGIELRSANRLWGQTGYQILPEFLALTDRCYQAGLAKVDFQTQSEQARQAINTWVAEQTAGKISELIGQGLLSAESRLVLTNAIYFLGSWENKFKPERTSDAPFYLASGETVAVPMMRQTTSFQYGEFDDLQVLEMPYRGKLPFHCYVNEEGEFIAQEPESPDGGSDFAMVVLLPRAEVELAEIERRLSDESLQSWLKTGYCKVQVSLPRFKLHAGCQLSEPLKRLGVTQAFNPATADFSQITSDPEGLYVSEIVHQAMVDVNEEGTEAAAATGVLMVAGCAREVEMPKEFLADRPFLFLIYDRDTKSIYFLGRVVNPVE